MEQTEADRRIIVNGKGDAHSLLFTIDNTFENEIKKNKNGEFAQKKEEKRTKSRKKMKRPFTKFSKCVIITGYCD